MDLRIVLLPDARGSLLFKQYSKILNQNFQCFFELSENAIPHITLVHLQTDESNFDKLIEDIGSFSKQTKKLLVSFDYPNHGTEEISFIGLYKEDKRIIEMRDAIRDLIKQYIIKISPFNIPHVTLTKLKNESDIERALENVRDFPKEEIKFDRLAICENAEHGTCTRILSSNVL